VLLWQKMEYHLLTLRRYEEIGEDEKKSGEGRFTGLGIAFATKADATLADLTESQRNITRRIFLRLIQFGEGRADTRRQQFVNDLRSKDDNPTLFEQTLQCLTNNRLLTLSGEEVSHSRNVDISHEALI